VALGSGDTRDASLRAPAEPRAGLDVAPSPEERRRVLDERARAIAPARETAVVATLPVVAFSLGGERYGIPVEDVFQILDAGTLSPLPAVPAWLVGATVSRGRIVPVVDLRQLLGLEGRGMSDLAKVVVVEHGADAFGLAAEVVEGQLELPRAGLSPVTAGPFAWIAPDRLAVLDLGKLAAPAALGG
jgi:purine-binding chemotaxis protein CheW